MNQGERIKKVRNDLGMTQEKFGEKIGMKKNSISQIESGKNSLTEQMFKSICREFNVNPEWLREGTGDMFIEPAIDTAYLVSELLENDNDQFYQAVLELVRTYEQLSPEGRRVIRDFGNRYIENLKNRKK